MRFLIVIILILLISPQFAMAQKSSPFSDLGVERFNYFNTDRSYFADPEYRAMTRQLVKSGNIGFDFQRYRLRYMQSSWYDPLGEEEIRELIILSDRAMGGEEKAFGAFRDIVANHLANIDVVMLARDKAREDSRFGNEQLYERVTKGLLRNVLVSGNGETRDDAFEVITLGEETMLFAQLGLRPLNTKYERLGMREFNRHIAEQIDTGRKKEVFVNVRFPMAKLRYDKQKQEEARNPLAR